MRQYSILILLITLNISAKAQFLDSLQVQAGSTLSIATSGYLPLWLISNRFGIIADKQLDLSSHLFASNSHRIGRWLTIYDTSDEGIYIDYAVDIYNNNHFGKAIVQQAYINTRYKNIKLSAGRFKQIIGEVDGDLSSGSLGISGNALPIPRILLAMEYTDIPLTNGWIQFKGEFSHGWMGKDQYIKDAFLHEKNFYLRIGKGKLKLYGGLQHYAVWGGGREDLPYKLSNSLVGFFKVLTVQESDDGSTAGVALPNRAGDHRGVIEAGAEWENDNVKVQLNNQTPFDMGQGIDIKNVDKLLSLNIINKNPENKWKKVVFEFIYTKQMNNFYAEKYRESYYNNGVYKTGWEYNDRIIGTPLFINRTRASKYFDNVKTYDWNAPANTINGNDNIISNRVIGAHAGFTYAFTDAVTSKTMFTYTQNYGDYRKGGLFDPYKSQFYSLQEISISIPKSKWCVKASVAVDLGEISNNIGSMLGVEWKLRE
jgi:hypothetical protein